MENQTHVSTLSQTREDLLAHRVFFSLNSEDVNYVNPEQHALLLDVVDFLTPENVQKYFVDFYQNKKPCCGRALYIYLTKILNDPKMAHLAHYRHKGQMIHVLEFSRRALASERRRNNDVFGRSVVIQVRLNDTEWVAVKMCQVMLCFMIDRISLFDHITEFLDEISDVIEQDEDTKKLKTAKLVKKNMTTPNSLDFYMSNEEDWHIRFDVESSALKKETTSGIDFYLC